MHLLWGPLGENLNLLLACLTTSDEIKDQNLLSNFKSMVSFEEVAEVTIVTVCEKII